MRRTGYAAYLRAPTLSPDRTGLDPPFKIKTDTMDLESVKKIMTGTPNLATALAMEFISTPEADECVARMDVNERTCQPFGYIHGGSSLALAETLAGVGSLALCPGCGCVGVSVSGSHVKTVLVGDTVTARARLLSKGHRLHVWKVDIFDTKGNLVSTASVTNYIRPPKV